jgi:hypothetical protein
MITIIAMILQVLVSLITPREVSVVIIPVSETADLANEYRNGCDCFDCYHAEVFEEAIDEFTALFNSYEVKRAKNGALMIRRGNSGSYKFCKKG